MGWQRSDVAGKRSGALFSVADVVQTVGGLVKGAGDETTTGDIYKELGVQGNETRSIQRHLRTAKKFGYLIQCKKRSHWKLGAKPLPRAA